MGRFAEEVNVARELGHKRTARGTKFKLQADHRGALCPSGSQVGQVRGAMPLGALRGHGMVCGCSSQCSMSSFLALQSWPGDRWAYLRRSHGARSQNKSNPDPGPRAFDLRYHKSTSDVMRLSQMRISGGRASRETHHENRW